MNKTFIFLILTIFIYSCSNSQYKAVSTRNAHYYNRGKAFFIEGNYETARNMFSKIPKDSKYYNQTKSFITKNLFLVFEKDIELAEMYASEYNIVIDYNLRVKIDSIKAINEIEKIKLEQERIKKEEERAKREQERIEQEKIEEELLEIKKQEFLDWAYEIDNYYTSIISGESYNAIADFFYDEGFGRDYKVGSTFKTVFFKHFYSDDSRKEYILYNVYLWWSYGYGKLYYDSDFSIWLCNNHYWSNGEWHNF